MSEKRHYDLLPCPFCGDAAAKYIIDGWHRVSCDRCGVMAGRHASEDLAREYWNRRASQVGPAPTDAMTDNELDRLAYEFSEGGVKEGTVHQWLFSGEALERGVNDLLARRLRHTSAGQRPPVPSHFADCALLQDSPGNLTCTCGAAR